MQPYYKKLVALHGHSILYKEDHLENPRDWHFHPEIEIQMNIAGNGTKFIGDIIEPFGAQDLVLLGENLPHFWRKENNNAKAIETEKSKNAHVIVIQFRKSFLGEDFAKVPELAFIDHLLERAKQGILFTGKTRELLQQSILKLKYQSKLERLLELVRILDIMAHTSEFRYLASVGYVERFHEQYDERINKVYEFTLRHFRKNIKIGEAALLINLSETSFCRYFKQRTQKNYLHFIIGLRIAYACQQLTFTRKDVKRISLECGYNSITNFNRQFRKATQLTPVAYRKAHQEI